MCGGIIPRVLDGESILAETRRCDCPRFRFLNFDVIAGLGMAVAKSGLGN